MTVCFGVHRRQWEAPAARGEGGRSEVGPIGDEGDRGMELTEAGDLWWWRLRIQRPEWTGGHRGEVGAFARGHAERETV
jgi:hypothetical protein